MLDTDLAHMDGHWRTAHAAQLLKVAMALPRRGPREQLVY